MLLFHVTLFTGHGKMSHLIFPIDCQPLVPEKMTVTEVFIQGIYIPLISVPEFAVTNVKIPEFSYNRSRIQPQ